MGNNPSSTTKPSKTEISHGDIITNQTMPYTSYRCLTMKTDDDYGCNNSTNNDVNNPEEYMSTKKLNHRNIRVNSLSTARKSSLNKRTYTEQYLESHENQSSQSIICETLNCMKTRKNLSEYDLKKNFKKNLNPGMLNNHHINKQKVTFIDKNQDRGLNNKKTMSNQQQNLNIVINTKQPDLENYRKNRIYQAKSKITSPTRLESSPSESPKRQVNAFPKNDMASRAFYIRDKQITGFESAIQSEKCLLNIQSPLKAFTIFDKLKSIPQEKVQKERLSILNTTTIQENNCDNLGSTNTSTLPDEPPSFGNLKIVNQEKLDHIAIQNLTHDKEGNNSQANIDINTNPFCIQVTNDNNSQVSVSSDEGFNVSNTNTLLLQEQTLINMYNTTSIPLNPMQQEKYESLIQMPLQNDFFEQQKANINSVIIDIMDDNNNNSSNSKYIEYDSDNHELKYEMEIKMEECQIQQDKYSLISNTSNNNYKNNKENKEMLDNLNQSNPSKLMNFLMPNSIKYDIINNKNNESSDEIPSNSSSFNNDDLTTSNNQSKMTNSSLNNHKIPTFSSKEINSIQEELFKQGSILDIEELTRLIYSIVNQQSPNLSQSDKELLFRLIHVLNKTKNGVNDSKSQVLVTPEQYITNYNINPVNSNKFNTKKQTSISHALDTYEENNLSLHTMQKAEASSLELDSKIYVDSFNNISKQSNNDKTPNINFCSQYSQGQHQAEGTLNLTADLNSSFFSLLNPATPNSNILDKHNEGLLHNVTTPLIENTSSSSSLEHTKSDTDISLRYSPLDSFQDFHITIKSIQNDEVNERKLSSNHNMSITFNKELSINTTEEHTQNFDNTNEKTQSQNSELENSASTSSFGYLPSKQANQEIDIMLKSHKNNQFCKENQRPITETFDDCIQDSDSFNIENSFSKSPFFKKGMIIDECNEANIVFGQSSDNWIPNFSQRQALRNFTNMENTVLKDNNNSRNLDYEPKLTNIKPNNHNSSNRQVLHPSLCNASFNNNKDGVNFLKSIDAGDHSNELKALKKIEKNQKNQLKHKKAESVFAVPSLTLDKLCEDPKQHHHQQHHEQQQYIHGRQKSNQARILHPSSNNHHQANKLHFQ